MHLYLSCGNEFNVDSQAPRGDCSECRSRQISRTFELGSKPCPYCRQEPSCVIPIGTRFPELAGVAAVSRISLRGASCVPQFQHRQIVINRFPVTAVDRFTRRVSINTPIREHLRDLCFSMWSLFTAGEFQRIRFHGCRQIRFLQIKCDFGEFKSRSCAAAEESLKQIAKCQWPVEK